MICVRLNGGLGNQLFQYATGRRLAQRHRTDLRLDTSIYLRQALGIGSETKRFYELGPLNIRASVVTIPDLVLIAAQRSGIARFLLNKKSKLIYTKEKHFHFDPAILDLPDNVYLDGFWQSEKYFADVDDLIRQELTVKERPTKKNKTMLRDITRINSVALHVRRGDYVADPKTRQFHGVCSPDYYRQGIKIVASIVKNPHFYIFSDDPAWCRGNVKTGFPTTYLDHNGPDKGYEDLRLMSNCKHFIIANSSFSWWGAWLSTNKEKIVIAPKRWFAQPGVNTKDILPRPWIKI